MYLVAPRRPGADVAVPRGSLVALVRYGTHVAPNSGIRFFRNASHGGQKKISLTLNLEIRSLERMCIFTCVRALSIGGNSTCYRRSIATDKSLQGFERELTISAIGRELGSPRSHAIRSNRQQSPRAGQVARSRPPLQPTGREPAAGFLLETRRPRRPSDSSKTACEPHGPKFRI